MLVVGVQPKLWAALHEHLAGPSLAVRWANPADLPESVRSYRPWPWAVASDGPHLPDPLPTLFATCPCLVGWLGTDPGRLPTHARVFASWRDLAEHFAEALGRTVGGLRLGADVGILDAGGNTFNSPALEALLGSHPHPVPLGNRAAATLRDLLQRRGLGIELTRDVAGWRLGERAVG